MPLIDISKVGADAVQELFVQIGNPTWAWSAGRRVNYTTVMPLIDISKVGADAVQELFVQLKKTALVFMVGSTEIQISARDLPPA